MDIKISIIVLILVLIFLSFLAYDTNSYQIGVVDEGVLHDLKGMCILDEGIQYEIGDRYEITYHYFIYNSFHRTIKGVE